MPNIDKKTIEHIADLVMIRLTEEESKTFAPQLDEILKYVEILAEVDTTDISETHQTTGLTNIFREDTVEPSLTQKQALANAAYNQDGYIKVPGKLSTVDA